MQSTTTLPFSQASENNKEPILKILQRYFAQFKHVETVLEIGSGTAQHGEYFSQQLPNLVWQCSDIPANLPLTEQRIIAAERNNLPLPLALDVSDDPWHCGKHNCVFTANSLHIMPFESVTCFFDKLTSALKETGLLFVYGPFKYRDEFTTESNARFDVWLKQQNPHSGIRDFERINELASLAGLTFVEDNPMPANNQLLVYELN